MSSECMEKMRGHWLPEPFLVVRNYIYLCVIHICVCVCMCVCYLYIIYILIIYIYDYSGYTPKELNLVKFLKKTEPEV